MLLQDRVFGLHLHLYQIPLFSPFTLSFFRFLFFSSTLPLSFFHFNFFDHIRSSYYSIIMGLKFNDNKSMFLPPPPFWGTKFCLPTKSSPFCIFFRADWDSKFQTNQNTVQINAADKKETNYKTQSHSFLFQTFLEFMWLL